jgi:hypothetical protein
MSKRQSSMNSQKIAAAKNSILLCKGLQRTSSRNCLCWRFHRFLFLLALVMVISLAACAPQRPRVQLPEKQPGSAPVELPRAAAEPGDVAQPGGSEARKDLPDTSYLEKRLFAYEEKYLQWQAVASKLVTGVQGIDDAGQWQRCQLYIGTLYDHYDRLREQAALPPGKPGRFQKPPVDPWEVLRADISYLESDCDAVYERVRAQLTQHERELSEPARKLEGVIGTYGENSQYQDVLAAYRNLERRFPGWQPSLKTRHAYGLALLRTNHLDKAGPVLREILPQLEPAEQLALKRLFADLLWATYQFDEAKTLYQSLAYHFGSWKENEHWVAEQLAILENVDNDSEEMAAYVSLLRVYLPFDGRHLPEGLEAAVARITDQFPGSIISQRARQILQSTRDLAKGWVLNQLASVTALKEQKQFPKAIAILKNLQQQELPRETRQSVQLLMDEVLLAEATEDEKNRLLQEQDVTSRWEEASHLFDLDQFDEANEILATLLGTEFEDRARSRIKEAGNRAAADLRRQAAGLFIKARESVNPERKMAFLLESRRLLKTIMDKYPEVDIASNVVRNLQVIDQHIIELNPDMVLEPAGPQAGRLP